MIRFHVDFSSEIKVGVILVTFSSTNENKFVLVPPRHNTDQRFALFDAGFPHSSTPGWAGPGYGTLLPVKKSFWTPTISATLYGLGGLACWVPPEPTWTSPTVTGFHEFGVVSYWRFWNLAGPITSVLTVVWATSESAATE